MEISHIPRRPFYTEYAWAFDLLIDRPVRKECNAITAWLIERGVLPGSALLDAGCGTGRYSTELGRRGYIVTGVDLSAELIAEAERSSATRLRSVSFTIGDIASLPASRYDAVLCRGVLNDFVDERARESAFLAFGRALRRDGVIVLDVRDWDATAKRKAREPLFAKTVTTDRGTLEYTSVTTLDPDHRRLIVSERHTLTDHRSERSTDYQFVMQCWSREELNALFGRAGFGGVAYFGAYDASIQAGATDRLVAIAIREAAPTTGRLP